MYLIRGYIAARAQLVTFILFILTIFFIEKFLESKKKRYAIGLIIIPILIANLHLAVFPFYFVLYLPYMAEYFIACLKKKENNYYSSAPKIQNFSPEQKKRINAAALTLINYIATDQDAYTNIVETINETTLKLMPELYIDKKAACPATMATRQFFNAYLYPYLLEHSERMMKIPTLLGQSCWIKNLIQKDFMQKKISAAVSDTRLYLMQHAAEMIRQNRPISAYEYQDKATEQRFYDVRNKDGTIKQIRIPNEAPPRPSDSAAWNKFAKKWNQ